MQRSRRWEFLTLRLCGPAQNPLSHSRRWESSTTRFPSRSFSFFLLFVSLHLIFQALSADQSQVRVFNSSSVWASTEPPLSQSQVRVFNSSSLWASTEPPLSQSQVRVFNPSSVWASTEPPLSQSQVRVFNPSSVWASTEPPLSQSQMSRLPQDFFLLRFHSFYSPPHVSSFKCRSVAGQSCGPVPSPLSHSRRSESSIIRFLSCSALW